MKLKEYLNKNKFLKYSLMSLSGLLVFIIFFTFLINNNINNKNI